MKGGAYGTESAICVSKLRKLLNNKGMGTVEMILIIVVLIGLVLIFKNQLLSLIETIFAKITNDSAAIML